MYGQGKMKTILHALRELASRTLCVFNWSISRLKFFVLDAGIIVAFGGLSLACAFASPKQPLRGTERHWVGTWGTAPAGPPLPADVQTFDNQTLRLVAHTSVGGRQVRVRFSNALGKTPLRIGAAHLALQRDGASVEPGTDRVLRFGGRPSITVPAGASVLSDPVDLDVAAMADLAISLHLPERTQAVTLHPWAAQTGYVSPPGDFTGRATLPTERKIGSWPFLTEVDVDAPAVAAIVALGDSITDSASTKPDANHRWPDFLARRLQAAGGDVARLGVVNRGISGNRMLRDPGEQPLFGKAALARFDRDVLATAGVKYLVVLIGINDIGHAGTGRIPASEEPTPDELIAGYRQLIARAHAKGIVVYGATLTPFLENTLGSFYTPAKEIVRLAVNEWIRSSGEFDGVIDFERALQDPEHPDRLLPAYDSGDHLHPNDKGTQAMAEAIPLKLFTEGTRR